MPSTLNEFLEKALNETMNEKDDYGNIKSTADYLVKKSIKMFDSKKADSVYLFLDDLILKKKGISQFIGELESFSKGKKVEFGKQSSLGAYIGALKDMEKAGMKFISAWDKAMDQVGWSK